MTPKPSKYLPNSIRIPMNESTNMNEVRELFNVVKANNLKKIQDVISRNKEIVRYRYYDCDNQNIFMIACKDQDGMSGVKKETLKILMDALGEDFNKPSTNDHWDPLHYTALNANKEKMEAIIGRLNLEEVNSLVYCSKDVLEKYDVCCKQTVDTYSNNALNVLLKYGKRGDYDQFKACFELLVENGVSVNQQDSEQRSPLSFINKDDELKKIFNKVGTKDKSVNSGFKFGRMNSITELVRNTVVQTQDQANGLDGNDEKFSSCTLLQLYCAKGLHDCVEYILNKGASPNRVISKNPTPPIIIAILEDHESIVKLFLNRNVPLPDEILLTLFKLCTQKDVGPITKYVKMICNHLRRNEKQHLQFYVTTTDEFDRTPLHYAVLLGCPDVTLTLLSFGASLIDKDNFGNVPLRSIEATVLEKFFDNCIKRDNGQKNDESNFSLKIDYKSLVTKNEDSPEGEFLAYLTQETRLNHLIIHPLVLTFLALKWQKIKKIVYLDLVLYAISYVCLVVYGAFFANMIKTPSLVVLIPFGILLFRTTVQLTIFKIDYLKSLNNIIDLFLIGGIIYIIAAGWFPCLQNRNLLVAYSVILLTSTLGIFQHMRHFSFFTIKVIMFEEITINFFHYIAFYMFPILAFAFCFFMLSENKKGMFFEFIYATMVMFAGDTENNFPSVKFKTNPIFGHVIYLVFVVLIVIILHNILIGLAVSDLQQVQKQAEFIDKKERSKFVTKIEHVCYTKSKHSEFRKLKKMARVFRESRVLGVQSENGRYVKVEEIETEEDEKKDRDGRGYRVLHDRQVLKTLQEVSKNMYMRDREVENPYTIKSLHEKFGRMEALMLQGMKISKRTESDNRATIL
ncbi:hypothetical protein Zmor_027581 [Zophobas morio]|uniref:Ion transport domain-containing protein n=1 Tax=Zophobas morio TaxID=2755281 RepID=A0AA38HNK8_9CUCU|nr:hypothetical protein Zmor_027581 [Zophobas morio]